MKVVAHKNISGDLDSPIYRIYSLWAFEHALRTKSLVLRAPSLWDDPYEDVAMHAGLKTVDPAPFKQEMLSKYLRPAYVQCWSLTGDSDALLRAYSRVHKDPRSNRNTTPGEEGVTVRSTPRKLVKAVNQWLRGRDQFDALIGRVTYAPASEIGQTLANLVWEQGPSACNTAEARADLLLLKRDFFSHESEVRVIVVGQLEMSGQPELSIPMEPDSVFDAVTFDPRLERFETLEREKSAKGLGYTGEIIESIAYDGVLFDLFTKVEL